MGQAYCAAGKFAEAIEAFRQVYERSGRLSPMLLTAWVAAAIELGYQDEAKARADDLLTINPNFTVSGCAFLERFAITGMKDRMAGGDPRPIRGGLSRALGLAAAA